MSPVFCDIMSDDEMKEEIYWAQLDVICGNPYFLLLFEAFTTH